jgi:hypothetical protein
MALIKCAECDHPYSTVAEVWTAMLPLLGRMQAVSERKSNAGARLLRRTA